MPPHRQQQAPALHQRAHAYLTTPKPSDKWERATARASPSHSCVALEHKRGVFTTRHEGLLDTALVLLFMTSSILRAVLVSGRIMGLLPRDVSLSPSLNEDSRSLRCRIR